MSTFKPDQSFKKSKRTLKQTTIGRKILRPASSSNEYPLIEDHIRMWTVGAFLGGLFIIYGLASLLQGEAIMILLERRIRTYVWFDHQTVTGFVASLLSLGYISIGIALGFYGFLYFNPKYEHIGYNGRLIASIVAGAAILIAYASQFMFAIFR